METSGLIFPTPKINNRLKLLMVLEIILLLIAYCLIFNSYRNLELQKTEESIRQMNFSLSEHIQQTADTLNTLTKSPIDNEIYSIGPTLWKYLTIPEKIEENPVMFENLFIERYHLLNLLFPDLDALFLYNPSGEILAHKYNNTLYYAPENLPENMQREISDEQNGSIAFFSQEEVADMGYLSKNKLLFAGRRLNIFTSRAPAVTVLTGINISDIFLTFKKYKLFDSQEFACFSSNGKLLLSSDGFPNVTWKEINASKSDSNSDIYFQTTSDTEHKLHSVIATPRKELTKASSKLNFIFLILLPVILISNTLIAYYIIQSVTRSYSKMAEKIYLQSLTEKDLNLQMLRSQINPHFLYNTLDNMRMASLKSGYQHLATMCELLAQILRYGVSDTNNMVTVGEEVKHLDDYIQLIKLRYTHINIHTSIDPAIMDYKIIKLLLQPLLENSINHGMGDDQSSGFIQIWGYQKENCLIFTVTDNGNGMSEEQLLLLRDYLDDKNAAFKSIGLKNIKKRIQLCYGPEYDLKIDSKLYKGTSASIILPIIDPGSDFPERNDKHDL